MRLTFLGTGTSFGVPVIGCDCRTCTSSDPRDRRTRHGAVVETAAGRRLLVDTPTELRLQLLATGIDAIDAIWFTHAHADHIHGIDDVRVFTVRRGDMDAYVPSEYRAELEKHFRYIFDPAVQPPEGSSKPRVRIHAIDVGEQVSIVGESFVPVKVPHGGCSVYGFRVGGLGYVTDAKRLPDDAVETLRGVDVLVLNALWFGRPHASHFNVEEAIEAARDVGASRT
ncbi:MAG TPA: MBL fold metallo-hydrolase, partial [Longimicrobiales bacterium]|nr:MBL fold metallo-hydrolase [Longimicrobiales bacterium]